MPDVANHGFGRAKLKTQTIALPVPDLTPRATPSIAKTWLTIFSLGGQASRCRERRTARVLAIAPFGRASIASKRLLTRRARRPLLHLGGSGIGLFVLHELDDVAGLAFQIAANSLERGKADGLDFAAFEV